MAPLLTVALFLVLQIGGSEQVYTVKQGDSLTGVGARLGVGVRVLAEANKLKPTSHLRVGQILKVDNRHVTPASNGAAVVINLPQRMLFLFGADGLAAAYPVAVGRPDWKTPVGDFEITTKETDPVWHVPPSIQEEMRRAGKRVITRMPPSPQNPLGQYWIGLSKYPVGIHGTNAPRSIYSFATHGCIRLHPDDIRAVFAKVDLGMSVRIVYEPVLIGRSEDAVFLEVHPDIYAEKGSDSLAAVLELARREGVLDMLDMPYVQEVIRKRDGIARDVTRR